MLATLWASGVAVGDALPHLTRLAPPLGRMQMLGGQAAPLVVVDYAHTPDALKQALTALRETARARGGQLVCVFGCGGDRDRGKRPLMGEVAARCADRVWLTSDNPRTEQPAAVIADIVAGAGRTAAVVEDRGTAIAQAIAEADDRDVVLIAGKGHEDYQEIGTRRLPFADADHAAQALARRGGDAR